MSTKTERSEAIKKLEERLESASGIYLTDYNKINVEQMTKLRISLREQGANYIVVKNKLAGIALERVGKGSLVEHLKGPCGIAYSDTDSTAPARAIKDFKKEYKGLLDLKVALVEGSVFDADEITRLADLPSREVLLSQLLSCLKAPMTGLAGTLNGILSKFVGTLEAVKNKKEAEGQP